MLATIAGRIAGILGLLGFVPYVRDIFRKENPTRPNRASWWIWVASGTMLALSYHYSGANETIWVPISYIIGPVVIALLSIKYGEGGWTPLDRLCITGTVFSIVLWAIFRSPVAALVMNLIIEVWGAVPTIKKCYLDPKSESRTAWTIFFSANSINILAVEKWTFAESVYPLYMSTAALLIIAFLWWPRLKFPLTKKDRWEQGRRDGVAQRTRRTGDEVYDKGWWFGYYQMHPEGRPADCWEVFACP